MKKLLALTFLLFVLPVAMRPAQAQAVDSDQVMLQIRLTTGERGRDSSSTTKSITISGETIVYKVTYGGRNRGRMPEQNKEFKLEGADQKRLIELIKAKNLLVTESIDRDVQVKGNYNYFVLSLSPEIGEKKGLISIKGPRNATDIKDSELYKNSIALIEVVFEILHRLDKEIIYERLIR